MDTKSNQPDAEKQSTKRTVAILSGSVGREQAQPSSHHDVGFVRFLTVKMAAKISISVIAVQRKTVALQAAATFDFARVRAYGQRTRRRLATWNLVVLQECAWHQFSRSHCQFSDEQRSENRSPEREPGCRSIVRVRKPAKNCSQRN
jgi:hypothetical protein